MYGKRKIQDDKKEKKKLCDEVTVVTAVPLYVWLFMITHNSHDRSCTAHTLTLVLLQFMQSTFSPIWRWCSGDFCVRLWHTQMQQLLYWFFQPDLRVCSPYRAQWHALTQWPNCQEAFCFDSRQVPAQFKCCFVSKTHFWTSVFHGHLLVPLIVVQLCTDGLINMCCCLYT